MNEPEFAGPPHAASAAGRTQWLHRKMSSLLRLVLVLAVSATGGWLAHTCHVPLGWLLGALAASAALAQLGLHIDIDGIRPFVLIFLGLSLGQTFDRAVLVSLAGSMPAIVMCAMLTVGAGLLGARVFSGYAGLDPKTAFFCGTPGGVVLMAIHARDAGVSEQEVVLAQTVRLILVVLVYPVLVAVLAAHDIQGPSGHAFAALPQQTQANSPGLLMVWWLAGLGAAFLGKKIGIPNPWMLAPCMLAALFAASGTPSEHVPPVWILIAQAVLGISLGSSMTREFIRGSHRLVLASVMSSVLLAAILILVGAGAAFVFRLPLAGSLLGMAPGGMPEMAVTAQALSVSVPLVLAFHFVRVVFSNLLLEPVWRCARAMRLV